MTDASIIADAIIKRDRSGSIKALWSETRFLRESIAWPEIPEYQIQHFACFAVPGVMSAVTPPVRSAPSFVAFRLDLDIKRVIGHVITAPVGSSLIAKVYKDDVLIATVTITDGANDADVEVSEVLVSGSHLDMSVTAVGSTTPGSDLTIQVECWGDVF